MSRPCVLSLWECRFLQVRWLMIHSPQLFLTGPVMDCVCSRGLGKGHVSRWAEVALPTRRGHLPVPWPAPL